ncbi:hypothetical protein N657DRAFT_663413 [Parathielavia appendiculata]|uniref:Uncharacterized protein n=1 Tax=Parathielavia appendiculata TaxID=2587402 RepID=A0AAN6U0S5_9PEZI|nr:hypothetical protein N657DRAFT_663413 [Parathielavia appendiculata]
MSQSMCWADNIILAMAPLGVITAIVGAIRVGGLSWLKAIIKRARESRAIVEAELMSPTSNEVCEYWNGQQIVRVMGKGPIRESIILTPKQGVEGRDQTNDSPENSSAESRPEWNATVRATMLGKRTFKKQEDPGKAFPNVRDEEIGSGLNSEWPDKVAVVQIAIADTPNLTLNTHNQVGRGKLYMVVVCGLVLQLGVLVYSGLATYHPNHMQLKDGNPVAGYAFPSTSETRYRPLDETEFFGIIPETALPLITTAHRARQETILHNVREAITAVGTMVSICGFVAQFSGLGDMHWSASVDQLGAAVVMTTFRGAIRRNLAKNSKAVPLVRGYELDWLAMTLGKPASAPWQCPFEDEDYSTWKNYYRPWAGSWTDK